jgi:hypothetical protein
MKVLDSWISNQLAINQNLFLLNNLICYAGLQILHNPSKS